MFLHILFYFLFLFCLNILKCREHWLFLGTFENTGSVVVCYLNHRAGERQDANQVGNCHQAVKGIGDIPCKVKIHRGTEYDKYHKNHFVDDGCLGAEQKFPGFRSVIAPSEYG